MVAEPGLMGGDMVTLVSGTILLLLGGGSNVVPLATVFAAFLIL